MLNSDLNLKLPPRFSSVDFNKIDNEVKVIVKKIRETRRGLYIHGECGTGKTYIAYAVLKYFSTVDLLKTRFYQSTEIFDKLKEDYAEDSRKNFNDIYNYVGLLIIDDIGSEKTTEWVLEMYYKIINKRYEQKMPIIFTSNLSIADLSEVYGDRIPSRIVEMCQIVELKGKDKRMKSAIKVIVNPYKD